MDLCFPKSEAAPLEMESSLLIDSQDYLENQSNGMLVDSMSQSNASVYEPSELGSMSSMDESVTEHIGNVSPCISLREKYKKEFKAAIKESYKYMMNQDMVESCKLIEGELSALDSDDMIHEGHAVSYNEFIRQYEDLKDWLKAICDQITHSSPLCLSEKHLNQAYHEELLQRLTRRTLFDEYATQLLGRYPSLKEDIIGKKTSVTKLWTDLERIVTSNGSGSHLNVLKDVELDLSNFEIWLVAMDKSLSELKHQVVFCNMSKEKLLEIVQAQHKEVQPKSKFVNSMLQMCDNLLSSVTPLPLPIENKLVAAKNKARELQHQWESLFIQILEWQLRIEEDFNMKHRWNHSRSDDHGSSDEGEGDSADAFKVAPDVLPKINEDNEENDIMDNCGLMGHSLLEQAESLFIGRVKEKSYVHDVGYSSEGQQSQNSLKRKSPTEPKTQACHCNAGSDLSDSSGVGISTATGSGLEKSKNETQRAASNNNNDDLDTSVPIDQASSLPCTEDELSCDDVPITSTVRTRFTQSLDNLNSTPSDVCPGLLDSALSDGELIHDVLERSCFFDLGIAKKRLGKSKRFSRRMASGGFGSEALKSKKHPKKRKLFDNACMQITKGVKDDGLYSKVPKILSNGHVDKFSAINNTDLEKNFVGMSRKNEDQLVPSMASIEDDLLSEMGISDNDLNSNSDLYWKDMGCRHSTPKAFRKFCYQSDLESDSDVEDFRVMVEDSLKALSYTKTCVAQTIKSSKRVMDSVEFLEPLATCRTSLKCLKELEEAFYSVKGNIFSSSDISKLQTLMKDWKILESQILHHLESGKQLILSEFELLQGQMSLCESAINKVIVDEDDFNFEAFLNAIHSYRNEKGKLLHIHQNIRDLKKNVSPLTNWKYSTDVPCYSDITFKLEYLTSHCQALLIKVETLLSACLEVFEPCMEFYKLGQAFDDLLSQSESCFDMPSIGTVDEPEFMALLSFKIGEVELMITEKLNKMGQLLLDVQKLPYVHQHFLKKMKYYRLAFRNFELKKESILGEPLINDKCNFSGPVDNVQASKLHKFGKKIIQFGLPLSVALLLGWIYNNSGGFCKETFDDWSLVFFPSLQHTRGRPPM